MDVGKKKSKKKTRGTKEQLSLETVVDLEGDHEDLQLLNDVDDNSDSDLENPGEDLDAEPVGKDEIQQFLKNLDIVKYRPTNVNAPEEKEKKKKNKEKSLKKEETLENEKPQPSTSTQAAETKKKKKERNKYKIQHDEVSSTTVDPSSELISHIKSYKPRNYLLVKAGGEALDSQDLNEGPKENLSESVVKQMEDFAEKLLSDEIAVYNKQKENTKKSDVGWMKTVLSSGTLADKMAALTVLVQESPLHSLQHLDSLITMAKKKGKRECIMATDSLKELFLTDILPDDRKLRFFSQRPFSSVGQAAGWNKDVIDRKLLMWYFESQLKDKYADFVKALQVMSHDTLPATKQKTVGTVYDLLVRKPEQEKLLLTMLINKVGDPNYKLASKVSHNLAKLVETHPNMKSVVVREVEQLLYRPNIPVRPQYYSICFLNQLSLSHKEKELAGQLIKIYFSFFKAYVKKDEVDSKMMSALLSGVNRAFPYAKLDIEFLSTEMENLYKIVHMVNFSTSIQALMLLYQVMDTSENISERFYIALYKKLSDPALKTSSKQAMFLNLVFKSMNKDISERRIKAFIKRLLQVCCYQQPQFTCGALILLSEVLKSKPGLLTLSHVEEESDEEEHFTDIHDSDSETEAQGDKEDIKTNVDVDGDDDEQAVDHRKAKQGHSWVHRANMNHKSETNDYDPYHRNPQYCHAENSCIWELEKLASHFHPTVSLFAQQILKGEGISYDGDPLQDFTLIRFLDRFVYKNPKKTDQKKIRLVVLSESTARQRIHMKNQALFFSKVNEKSSAMGHRHQKVSGIKSMPVNSEQFVKLEEGTIPVDDRFFHRYFTQKAAREKKDKAEVSDEESETESVGDDEFDDYLDKYEEHMDDGDFGDLDLDFAEEFGKKKGKKKSGGDSDLSDDDDDDDDFDEIDDNLSDEEVDFSDDGDFAQQFQDADDVNIDDDDVIDDTADIDDDGSGPSIGFDEEDIEFSDDEKIRLDVSSESSARQRMHMKNQALFSSKDKNNMQELAPKSKGGKRKRGDTTEFKQPSKKGKKTTSGLFAAAEEFSHMIDENTGNKLDLTGAEALANKDKADVKQLKWEVERDRWLQGKSDWRKKKGGNFRRKQGQFKNKGKQFRNKGKHKGKGKKK